MTGHTADASDTTGTDHHDSRPILCAEIILSGGESAECTIFPLDATDVERVTTWITAKEGSFISLEDVR